MTYTIRVVLRCFVFVTVLSQFGALEAQTDRTNVDPELNSPEGEFENQNSIEQTEPPFSQASSVSEKFPHFWEVQGAGSLPLNKDSRKNGFPWPKFAIVLLAFCVWLRTMQLSLDDSRILPTSAWTKWLFSFGFVGIILAILIPAHLIGAGLLFATCVVPFWKYLRWRNGSIDQATARLGWRHLVFRRSERFQKNGPRGSTTCFRNRGSDRRSKNRNFGEHNLEPTDD